MANCLFLSIVDILWPCWLPCSFFARSDGHVLPKHRQESKRCFSKWHFYHLLIISAEKPHPTNLQPHAYTTIDYGLSDQRERQTSNPMECPGERKVSKKRLSWSRRPKQEVRCKSNRSKVVSRLMKSRYSGYQKQNTVEKAPRSHQIIQVVFIQTSLIFNGLTFSLTHPLPAARPPVSPAEQLLGGGIRLTFSPASRSGASPSSGGRAAGRGRRARRGGVPLAPPPPAAERAEEHAEGDEEEDEREGDGEADQDDEADCLGRRPGSSC